MSRYFLVLHGTPCSKDEGYTLLHVVDDIYVHDSSWERPENAPINQFKPENDFGPHVFVTDFTGLMRYISEASCIEDIDLDTAHYLLNMMRIDPNDRV